MRSLEFSPFGCSPNQRWIKRYKCEPHQRRSWEARGIDWPSRIMHNDIITSLWGLEHGNFNAGALAVRPFHVCFFAIFFLTLDATLQDRPQSRPPPAAAICAAGATTLKGLNRINRPERLSNKRWSAPIAKRPQAPVVLDLTKLGWKGTTRHQV